MSTGVLDGSQGEIYDYLRAVDMKQRSTVEEVQTLEDTFHALWTKPAYHPGFPPRINKAFAPGIKSPEEVIQAWKTIFSYRRKVQIDDTLPIKNLKDRSRLHGMWFKDFQKTLTDEQRQQKHRKHTSAFNAYLKNQYGGKFFVMAVWQLGLSWAPTQQMLDNDYNGALEHVR